MKWRGFGRKEAKEAKGTEVSEQQEAGGLEREEEIRGKVEQAETIEELQLVVSEIPDFERNDREITSDLIAKAVGVAMNGFESTDVVTRAYGIRAKVVELIAKRDNPTEIEGSSSIEAETDTESVEDQEKRRLIGATTSFDDLYRVLNEEVYFIEGTSQRFSSDRLITIIEHVKEYADDIFQVTSKCGLRVKVVQLLHDMAQPGT